MSATLSLTETQTITALGNVLTAILPAGFPIIRGEINRVAEPSAADFLVMVPILRERLATNTDTYTDEPTADPPVGTRNSLVPTKVTIQLDIHGPSSADNAEMIAALMRDEYATIAFAATGLPIQPLYAEDPRQTPFENAEQQTEFRWTVDIVLQANPVIGTPQDFADVVKITPIEADQPPG